MLEGTLLHCHERKNCWNKSPPLCLSEFKEAHPDLNISLPSPHNCPSMTHLAESSNCNETCVNDGTCRSGIQCCSATCGYNCAKSYKPKSEAECCSISYGYRIEFKIVLPQRSFYPTLELFMKKIDHKIKIFVLKNGRNVVLKSTFWSNINNWAKNRNFYQQ